MSSVISPSLSTIDQPGFKMGKTACKLLLKQIKKEKREKNFEHRTVELKTKLILRNSTF